MGINISKSNQSCEQRDCPVDPDSEEFKRLAFETALRGLPASDVVFHAFLLCAFGVDSGNIAKALFMLLDFQNENPCIDVYSTMIAACDRCAYDSLDMYVVADALRDLRNVFVDHVNELRLHAPVICDAELYEHFMRCKLVHAKTPEKLRQIDDEFLVSGEVKNCVTGVAVPGHWIAFANLKPDTDDTARQGHNRLCNIETKKRTITSDPFLPELGTRWLEDGRQYKTCTAGGFPSACLNPSALSKHSDVDVYVVCPSGYAPAALKHAVASYKNRIKSDDNIRICSIVVSKNAITFNMCHKDTLHRRIVQFSLRVYESISAILLSYDYACACVAFDGQKFMLTPLAYIAFATSHVVVNPLIASTTPRIIKYKNRGFYVLCTASAETAKQAFNIRNGDGNWTFSAIRELSQTGHVGDAPANDEWGSDTTEIVNQFSPPDTIDAAPRILFTNNDVIVHNGAVDTEHLFKFTRARVIVGKNSIKRSVTWFVCGLSFYDLLL